MSCLSDGTHNRKQHHLTVLGKETTKQHIHSELQEKLEQMKSTYRKLDEAKALVLKKGRFGF